MGFAWAPLTAQDSLLSEWVFPCCNDEMSRLLTVHLRRWAVVSLQIRNVDAIMMECKLASCTLCPLWSVRTALLLWLWSTAFNLLWSVLAGQHILNMLPCTRVGLSLEADATGCNDCTSSLLRVQSLENTWAHHALKVCVLYDSLLLLDY